MLFDFLFIFSIYLFALLNYCIGSIGKKNSGVCQTNYTANTRIPNFQFDCSINEALQPFSECGLTDGKSLLFFSITSLYLKNVRTLLHCKSNYPMSYKVFYFNHWKRRGDYIKDKSDIVALKYSDPKTYSYNIFLDVIPKSYYHYADNNRRSVRYDFHSLEYPTEIIRVVWASKINRKTQPFWLGKNEEYPFWAEKKNTLLVDERQQVVKIPCGFWPGISNKTLLWHDAISNSGKVPLSIDNKTLSYDPSQGFLLNVGNYKNFEGKYSCRDDLSYNRSHVVRQASLQSINWIHLELVKKPNFTATVTQNVNHYFGAPFSRARTQGPLIGESIGLYSDINQIFKTTVTDYFDKSYTLKCRSRNSNVTIVQSQQHQDLENPFVFDRINAPDLKLHVITQSNKTDSSVEYITPILHKEEQGDYRCHSLELNRTLHMWSIVRADETLGGNGIHTTYDRDRNVFMCWSRGSFKVTINQMDCHSLAGCNSLLHCLTMNKEPTNCDTGTHAVPCNPAVEGSNHCTGVALTTIEKGIIQCSTGESWNIFQNIYFLGFNGKLYLGLEDNYDVEVIMTINGPTTYGSMLPVPGNFTFYCVVNSFFLNYGHRWFLMFKNGSSSSIPMENVMSLENRKNSNPRSKMTVYLTDANISKVICSAPINNNAFQKSAEKWKNISLAFTGHGIVKPTILSRASKHKLFKSGGFNQSLICEAHGFPNLTITWTKNGNRIDAVTTVQENQTFSKSAIIFPVYSHTLEGDYTCTASNLGGNDTKVFTVGTETTMDRTQILLVSLTVSLTFILIATLAAFLICWNKIKKARLREKQEILDLLHGTQANGRDSEKDCLLDRISKNNMKDPLCIPYDTNYELPKHSFVIDFDKMLGKGESGAAYQGKIAKSENIVAFKTTNSRNSMVQLKSLVSELKILIYIGKHENTVELLGSYTQEIENGILYVALELCGLGSLQSYLRTNKGRFLTCPVLKSYFEYENTNNFPDGKDESNTNSSVSSNVHSIKGLVKWSSEIANAMEYLAYKNIIHSDLATRNILLTVDFSAKLTDFGLSRKTYNNSEYWKKGQDPLPWRWMALESLQTLVFSEKTDVWSYGITLWEIFSLGDVPYPGISPSQEFVQQLEKGLRNPRPKYSSQNIYEIMLKCWHLKPEQRPTFSKLKNLFTNAYEIEKYDFNLQILENEHYLEMEL